MLMQGGDGCSLGRITETWFDYPRCKWDWDGGEETEKSRGRWGGGEGGEGGVRKFGKGCKAKYKTKAWSHRHFHRSTLPPQPDAAVLAASSWARVTQRNTRGAGEMLTKMGFRGLRFGVERGAAVLAAATAAAAAGIA
jgi:hypothetical protein